MQNCKCKNSCMFVGLGLFEYMQLAQELKTEPIYVINNGISHQEATPPDRLAPFITETLEALEFITGADNTTWGSVRASMGRKRPWKLNYLAIGNEVRHLTHSLNSVLKQSIQQVVSYTPVKVDLVLYRIRFRNLTVLWVNPNLPHRATFAYK